MPFQWVLIVEETVSQLAHQNNSTINSLSVQHFIRISIHVFEQTISIASYNVQVIDVRIPHVNKSSIFVCSLLLPVSLIKMLFIMQKIDPKLVYVCILSQHEENNRSATITWVITLLTFRIKFSLILFLEGKESISPFLNFSGEITNFFAFFAVKTFIETVNHDDHTILCTECIWWW